jgi:hypothetical protein
MYTRYINFISIGMTDYKCNAFVLVMSENIMYPTCKFNDEEYFEKHMYKF